MNKKRVRALKELFFDHPDHGHVPSKAKWSGNVVTERNAFRRFKKDYNAGRI